MKLSTYLSYQRVTVAKFSEQTGILPDTIHKYKFGLRIPKPEQMKIIYNCTDGEVQPNDFYDIA